ncbi:hypothetical protein ACIA8E_24970 [Streptomyces sp. NPDC051664]|uniref:hypothetical protein n=1 Tax=Streptomyces sp. NPDC051664 TaxID=3365668 RepID=UPI0037B14DA3
MGLKDSVTGGHLPGYGAHPAAEAASWALIGSVGQGFVPRGIAVCTLHVGLMDMSAHVLAGQKIDPAPQALDGLQYGLPEIVADDVSRQIEQSLATQPAAA